MLLFVAKMLPTYLIIASITTFILTCMCLWATFVNDYGIGENSSFVTLSAKNIASVIKEVIFTKLLLLIFSIAGLLYLLYLLHFSESNELTKGELLSGIAAMLAPIFTYALQGFTFPKDRKLNSLLYLFYKDSTNDDEQKFIRET
jgi:hypothetical protein